MSVDEPATKRDLAELEQRLKTELRTEIGGLRSELRADMRTLKTELLEEIGPAIMHAVQVVGDRLGAQVGVIEEKYKDLPSRVAALEEHAGDSAIHVRPSPAKRSRRPKK